jgi:hypothetical protein
MRTVDPPQFLGLRGASLLRTPFWVLGREGLLDAVRCRAITAVTGPRGTGKTFLLDSVEPECGLPVTRLEPHDGPTMLSITDQLLEALTGEIPRGTRHRKVRPLLDALRTPRVVMFDEAQRMNRGCLDHLRSLHDSRDTNFALVLAGGEGCWAVLGKEPQLRRRIWRPTFFKILSPEEIRTLLPRYHPIWDTDPHVLDLIDSHFSHGVLGNWAAITATATMCRANPTQPVTVDELPGLLLRHGIDPPSN